MDRYRTPAGRRLLWALGASALLHLWLVQTPPPTGAPRAAVAVTVDAPVTASLSLRLDDGLPPDPAPRRVPAAQPKFADSAQAQRPAVVAAVTQVRPAEPREPRVAPSSNNAAVLAQPSDPTYYAARDLDVFPKAITALDLERRAGAAGKVRATVLIDESGAVNEVRAVEASAAEFENAARDLLLRTRFSPASKDGRIVKAQVLVSLDYGSP